MGQDFVLPSGATLLAAGYVHAMARGADLYACKTSKQAAKSVDGGNTWTDFAQVFATELHSVFPASNGYLYACEDSKVYRSTDDGGTWAEVFDSTAGYVTTWGWAESSTGTLFAGLYSGAALIGVNVIYVYRSTDDGATWTRLEGLHGFSSKHVHQVFVDPETDRLYVTIGDNPKKTYYSDDEGDTWVEIFAARSTGFTGYTSTATARFMADDQLNGNQVVSTTDDSALSVSLALPAEYDVSFGSVAAVHGTDTVYATWWNEFNLEGQKASIWKTTDGGANWSAIASSAAMYHFSMPATDYRHRIPAELGYLIVECKTSQMIRIPV